MVPRTISAEALWLRTSIRFSSACLRPVKNSAIVRPSPCGQEGWYRIRSSRNRTEVYRETSLGVDRVLEDAQAVSGSASKYTECFGGRKETVGESRCHPKSHQAT